MKAVRPFLVLLALIVLGPALAACGEKRSRDDLSYVALGDSYTAAPGVIPADGSDTCFRSASNYPHQVAEKAGLELTDVSCSAASTAAVPAPQLTLRGRRLPPQLDAVRRSTDVVTIGLGANDFGLISRIFLNCVQLARNATSRAPCTDVDTSLGDRNIANRLDEVQNNLEDVIDAVQAKAPEARILVIGYPEIFPEDRVCDLLPLAVGDLPLARGTVSGLNRAAEAAARSRDVDYIDVFSATRGHHICSEDPWIAGAATIEGRYSTAWHPYVEEQKTVARLVLARLN